MMRSTSIVLLFLFSIFRSGSAQEAFIIKDYKIRAEVFEDGYFDIYESIEVEFSEPRHGIYRRIPVRYIVNGQKTKIEISDIHVQDDKYRVQHSGGNTSIRIGDADRYVEGEKTYQIRYRVYDAFIFDSTGTEFYWNFVGTEWDVPIEQVEIELHVPPKAGAYLENFSVFAGTAGSVSQEKLESSLDINTINIATTATLKPKEGVTLAVKFPPGTIHKYEKPRVVDHFYAIPGALLALLIGFWSSRGRQHKVQLDEVVTSPPGALFASEVGALVDDKINDRDIIALIPEWGAKGYIRVKSVEKEYGHKSDDLYIEKLTELPAEYPAYQHTFFDGLFAEGDFAFLSDFKYKFTTIWQNIRKDLRKVTRRPDLYDMSYYGVFHKGGMIALFVVCIIIGIVLMAVFSLFITGALTMILGVGALIIHFTTPRKTTEGALLQARLKSFQRFLKKMPAEEVQKLAEKDPYYFEKTLPYAVAFGYDKTYTRQFSEYREHSPSWFYNEHRYETGKRTTMRHFSDALVFSSVTSAFTAVKPTPSSSTSGSSGGGFSGGGFGGGGGGSW